MRMRTVLSEAELLASLAQNVNCSNLTSSFQVGPEYSRRRKEKQIIKMRQNQTGEIAEANTTFKKDI